LWGAAEKIHTLKEEEKFVQEKIAGGKKIKEG